MLLRDLGVLLLATSVKAAQKLCGKDEVFTQLPFLWNNNKWNDDGNGYTCTYVPDNATSASNGFQVLWEWGGAPVVRAYPHIEFESSLLPLYLNNLSSLRVAASWEMSPESLVPGASADPNTQPNAGALKSSNVEANVCLDIFADPDAARSQIPAEQKYEIMVWFGQFGSGALPVGNTQPLNPPVVTLIQDTEFKLYTGTNFNGQIVHSWVANKTLTTFDMDFAPLLGFLAAENFMPVDVFLGTIHFGTETFSSSNTINFTTTSFEIGIETTNGDTDGTLESLLKSNATANNVSWTEPTATGHLPVATQVTPTNMGSALQVWFLPGSSAFCVLVASAWVVALMHVM